MTTSAGDFGPWLIATIQATRTGEGADVPCGTCRACCTSAMFVLIEPDDAAAREHIPADILVPAPGLPDGYSLLGYDGSGCCPMLGEAGCTIYEHRPRTCRVYDCRLLAATGLEPSGARQEALQARVSSWTWNDPTATESVQQAALRAAARYVGESEAAPDFDRGIAVLALAVHDLFWSTAADGTPHVVTPDAAAVDARIAEVLAG